VVQIAGSEFNGRLLQLVLPSGFKRIRHYGLLAPAAKRESMSQARALLEMPQPQRQATEDAQAWLPVVFVTTAHAPAASPTGLTAVKC
jgi:hypothetical protein